MTINEAEKKELLNAINILDTLPLWTGIACIEKFGKTKKEIRAFAWGTIQAILDEN